MLVVRIQIQEVSEMFTTSVPDSEGYGFTVKRRWICASSKQRWWERWLCTSVCRLSTVEQRIICGEHSKTGGAVAGGGCASVSVTKNSRTRGHGNLPSHLQERIRLQLALHSVAGWGNASWCLILERVWQYKLCRWKIPWAYNKHG